MIVALDTGFLMQLADAKDEAWQVYISSLNHNQPFVLVTTPATTDLLEFFSRQTEQKSSSLAFQALRALNSEWKIKTSFLNESQRKTAWIISYHLRQTRLISENFRFETEVLAEAILTADVLLAADDSPIHKVDQSRLAFEVRTLGMSPLIIFNPSSFLEAIQQ